ECRARSPNAPLELRHIMMTNDLIEYLKNKNLLSDLDVHFALLMERLSEAKSPEFSLACALTSRFRNEGHICFDLALFAGEPAAEGERECPACPGLEKWIECLKKEDLVGSPGQTKPLILDGSRLYLYRYWEYENSLIEALTARTKGEPAFVHLGILKAGLPKLFPTVGGETDWQKVAVFASVLNSFCVVSGGPGTGKTYTVAKILALLQEQRGSEPLRIALAAPTGKAAARLQEAIRKARQELPVPEEWKSSVPSEASTIHRLLGSVPDSPYFRHDSSNPLPADVVVVDEASMVDLALMSKLVQAVPAQSRLILLGDKDQLASVEAGAVLGDICDTGTDHGHSPHFCAVFREIAGESLKGGEDTSPALRDSIVQLKKSYRFGAASGIGAVSRAVNDGDGKLALECMKKETYPDARWSELPRPESVSGAIRSRVLEGFSHYLKGRDPAEILERFSRFRVLCALREGPFGIKTMTFHIEQVLKREGLIQADGRWYRGRPVMVTRNDYHLRLFNGDIGIALPDPEAGGSLRVYFASAEGGIRKFPPLRLPEHETVYAMTVHKSQGSEFDHVLLLLPDVPSPVLTRELIYTAVTRARARVEIWGREEVFLAAVSRRIIRTSGLRDALWK
ncbi:MAG TPA: exodeoxyribonuclease V subunit alpha, partial [Thermodesulfobacteriota bacterium]|nr:exodeoxyribonuclease V subunit alpha [Thermodesulfobacteriota bacterium]